MFLHSSRGRVHRVRARDNSRRRRGTCYRPSAGPACTRSEESPLTRTVLLWHHDIPPGAGLGGDHFDWMLERAPGSPLITFRLRERPDAPACQGFAAERLADHRPAYLDYEGPVSGDRGRVERLAQGACLRLDEPPGRFEAVCVFAATPELEHHFCGLPEGNGRWRFSCRVRPREKS